MSDGYYTAQQAVLYERELPRPAPHYTRAVRWKRGEQLGAGAVGTVYMGLNADTGALMAAKKVSLAGLNQDDTHAVRMLETLQVCATEWAVSETNAPHPFCDAPPETPLRHRRKSVSCQVYSMKTL